MRVRLSALSLLVAACTAPPRHQSPPSTDLAALLPTLATAPAGGLVAIAYRDLATGAAVSVHGDETVHAASTMKVPVMLELFARHERGEFDLDAPLRLRNEFASIVDGSPYTLTPADDSDPDLYALVGSDVSARELTRRMIVRSSNLATNTLIALADPELVTARCAALGASRTRVLRGVEDGKAFAQGLNNVTTADDLAALLVALAQDRAASVASCAAMREILFAQEDRELIPAGLPADTRVAHKTGQINRHRHDMAIVYPRDASPFVLVVMTRGFTDPADAAATIAEIARRVYDAHPR